MITDLPYVDETFRNLYKIYIKNRDVSGLMALISIFTSSTLNHIIYQLDNIIENQIVDDNLGYLRTIRENYKKYLEMI